MDTEIIYNKSFVQEIYRMNQGNINDASRDNYIYYILHYTIVMNG